MEENEGSPADDLIEGMENIAAFFGMSPRKGYHLAAAGLLPGCFMMGGRHFCSKSVAREDIANRARRATPTKPEARVA